MIEEIKMQILKDMKKLGWNIGKLCRRADLSHTTGYNFLAHGKKPTATTLEKFLDAIENAKTK